MQNKIIFTLTYLFACLLTSLHADQVTKLPIGMNVDAPNYWAVSLPYRNVIKASTDWFSFNLDRDFTQSKTGHLIPRDDQGYPLEIPYIVDPSQAPQGLRVMINNNYKGKFLFTYEGEGEFKYSGPTEKKNGKTYFILNGTGSHIWLDILKSKKGNHIHNIQILPVESSEDKETLFNPLFVEGLKSFHCLRFMDWNQTNGSEQRTWDQRSKPDYFTQGADNGPSIEHAIQLCNLIHADAWFCMPHQADDDYIANFAKLVKENLDPTLKVYVEYSNEVWNWGFIQTSYVVKNAIGHPEQYVTEDLIKIDPRHENFQIKDAYMMQRTFRIWTEVFGNAAKDRLVRVAAVQAGWHDNTRIILEYLFKKNKKGETLNDPLYSTSTGAGCDALSPAGYFYFLDNDVKKWEAMDPSLLTPNLILDAVDADFWESSGSHTVANAEMAKAWNIDLVVYEGGQHLVPPGGREGPLANAIWDAQIEPKMYDLYMKLFDQHALPEINCKLFCVLSYVSARKTRSGSWGHLENLEQLREPSRLMQVAPKYQALMDRNIPKN